MYRSCLLIYGITIVGICYRNYARYIIYRSCLLIYGITIVFISWWFWRKRERFCRYKIWFYSTWKCSKGVHVFLFWSDSLHNRHWVVGLRSIVVWCVLFASTTLFPIIMKLEGMSDTQKYLHINLNEIELDLKSVSFSVLKSVKHLTSLNYEFFLIFSLTLADFQRNSNERCSAPCSCYKHFKQDLFFAIKRWQTYTVNPNILANKIS